MPSESSFKRVLDCAGCVEHRHVRKREHSGPFSPGAKRRSPNEVWTVDFKGWWYGAPGHRCEPLAVRDEFGRYVLELRAVPIGRPKPCTLFSNAFSRNMDYLV